jgi:hypothetical protein
LTENERFGACFRDNWVYKFGHRTKVADTYTKLIFNSAFFANFVLNEFYHSELNLEINVVPNASLAQNCTFKLKSKKVEEKIKIQKCKYLSQNKIDIRTKFDQKLKKN